MPTPDKGAVFVERRAMPTAESLELAVRYEIINPRPSTVYTVSAVVVDRDRPVVDRDRPVVDGS
jgi:hypothetical protein